VITLRLNNPTADEQAEAVEQLLDSVVIGDLDACVIMVERGSTRRRTLLP
jgi:hypothetical protein